MAHRVGGRTQDLYLSAQLEFRSGLPMGLEEWGRQLTTRQGELGSQNWVILAAGNEPKIGVLPIVYLHAGMEIRSAIPYAIHRESDRDTQALGSQRSPCHSAW